MNKPYKAIVIIGPTASGKTALSEIFAEQLDGEIINSDVGQFYEPLSIGTAKPNYKDYKFKAHLFDVLTEPVDFDVAEYRNKVLQNIHDIEERGRVPIFVGGSLFYLKSLFFLQHDFSLYDSDVDVLRLLEIQGETPWDKLNHIDPIRAKEIHKNDSYRIKRALDIWLITGVSPSSFKPVYNSVINPIFVVLDYPVSLINSRINVRTETMLSSGWIDEAEGLYGSLWEDFLTKKQLIGYKEIFEWIRYGKNIDTYADLVETIKIKTRQYSKRQRTFWKSFVAQLEQNKEINECNNFISFNGQPSGEMLYEAICAIRNFFDK